MTECPHCHREIQINEINYGTLFNCPLCNAVYFVGWDGRPEIPPAPEEMAAENAEVDTPVEVEIRVDNAFLPLEENSHDAIIDNSTYSSSDNESVQGETVFDSMPVEESEALESENFEITADPQEDPIPEGDYDFSQPLGENAMPTTDLSSTADEPGFEDVTNYANSDANAGPLTYNVYITGIDSGKIYGQLKEALTDSRFGWDARDVMKTVQGGSLSLKGLNPAKAFVLVNRIKYLPLQISWRQDVLATS